MISLKSKHDSQNFIFLPAGDGVSLVTETEFILKFLDFITLQGKIKSARSGFETPRFMGITGSRPFLQLYCCGVSTNKFEMIVIAVGTRNTREKWACGQRG